jgi:hypothetical protein
MFSPTSLIFYLVPSPISPSHTSLLLLTEKIFDKKNWFSCAKESKTSNLSAQVGFYPRKGNRPKDMQEESRAEKIFRNFYYNWGG